MRCHLTRPSRCGCNPRVPWAGWLLGRWQRRSLPMTADQFRSLALEISGAIESSHMNHPDFRIDGKVFASLGYPDDDHGMVKLTPEQQRGLLKKAPSVFDPCAGA